MEIIRQGGRKRMRSKSVKPITILKWMIPVAVLAYVYYPTFVWMWDRWFAGDSYYSHGFLIPLVSLYWIFQQRKKLAKLKQESSLLGLGILVFGIVLQVISSVLRIYFLSAISLIVVLLGAVHFLFGIKIFKATWFPIGFLFLMIPLPLLIISEITLQLKFFVAQVAVQLLNASGIPALREGSYIQMRHAEVLVGDPCSGLRSFLAFLCLGFVFAYGEGIAFWKRATMVLIAFPLAIVSNIGRVFLLGLVGEIYGVEAIHGWFHEGSGILSFSIAFIFLLMMRKQLEAMPNYSMPRVQ